MAVATAAALATAASAAYVASENRKAGKEAAAAIESGRIDPNEVSRLTREQGIQNLRDSIDIESELTPENQQVRRGATRALLPLIGDQGTTEQIAGVEGQIDEGEMPARVICLRSPSPKLADSWLWVEASTARRAMLSLAAPLLVAETPVRDSSSFHATLA